MQEKKELIINFFKKYYKKKRFWGVIILVIILLSYFMRPAATSTEIVLDKARYVDLKQTVLATGTVTSNVDLSLSFNSSGTVKSLRVKVGDNVKKGDILATVDQGSVLASLTQARGAYASAQAKYKKIIEGSEVALAEVALSQAKIVEDLAVKNAYQNLLNSTHEAFLLDSNEDKVAPIISGTYTLGKEGTIKIKPYSSSGGYSFTASGLVSGTKMATSLTPQPIGNSGLYITFPEQIDTNIEWTINIPNQKAPNYLTNYNAYQEAISHRNSIIEQRTTELNLKKAQASGSDLDLARADILSAEGQLQAAQAKFEDTVIRAPADGTITNIDVKLGELSEVQKPIMMLQDVSNLYIEAKINESSIANLKLGQRVSMTFDAFGDEKVFTGAVVHVDPSSTTEEGIVNYKIKASIDNLDKSILTGMNADIEIITAEGGRSLVVPKAAVFVKDGANYVNVITDLKRQKYKEVEVKIGLLGDGNLIEITSGLSDGNDIAIVSK